MTKQFGIDFQIKMLAIAVREPLFLQLYADTLRPAIFSSQYLRDFSSWITEYYLKFKAPPTHTSLAELFKQSIPSTSPLLEGYQHLLEQIYTIDISDSAFVQEQLTTAARQLAVRSALRLMDERNEQLEFDELMPLLTNALQTGAGIGDLGLELVKDAEAAMLKFGDLEQSIETGFHHLQSAVGNFCTGEETIIVAPPNIGKTCVLGNLAYGAARNDSVVMYYTLEIGAERMLCRFLAKMTKLPTKQLQDTRQQSTSLKLVRASLKKFKLATQGTVYVKYFPARTASVETLRNHLAMARSQGLNPQLIVVDYADLLKPLRTAGKTYETLRETHEELRAVAAEFNVHLMTASQSTRETLYADFIDLDNLAESWGKAQTADTIVALCQNIQEQEAKVARLYVAKARNETRGSIVHLSTNYQVLEIKEIEKPDYDHQLRSAGHTPTARTESFLATKNHKKSHPKQTTDEFFSR